MTRYIRSSELMQDLIGDELVALHVDKGQCYGMNSVATDIWQLLERPRSVDELCNELVRRFRVDESTCRTEVVRMIAWFRDEGLVTVV